MDPSGFFFIRGRLKELLVTSGGKNVAPVPIEDRIRLALPDLVSAAVVIGDGRNYLTCLLALREEVDPDTQVCRVVAVACFSRSCCCCC